MIKKIIGKIMKWKQDSEDLEVCQEIIKRYQILLKRISEKCEETDYNMPVLKFRKIKELAETDISQDCYDNGLRFWQDDEDDILEETEYYNEVENYLET